MVQSDKHYILYLRKEHCAARDKRSPCNGITDLPTCLTSIESRSGVVSGVELEGSKCGWCPNGPCTGNNDNKCEPSNWLEAKGANEFETCLEGIVPP